MLSLLMTVIIDHDMLLFDNPNKENLIIILEIAFAQFNNIYVITLIITITMIFFHRLSLQICKNISRSLSAK